MTASEWSKDLVEKIGDASRKLGNEIVVGEPITSAMTKILSYLDELLVLRERMQSAPAEVDR